MNECCYDIECSWNNLGETLTCPVCGKKYVVECENSSEDSWCYLKEIE